MKIVKVYFASSAISAKIKDLGLVIYVVLVHGAVVRAPAFPFHRSGSILSDNIVNVTRSKCVTHVKRISQHCQKVWVFSRCSGFLPKESRQFKVD